MDGAVAPAAEARDGAGLVVDILPLVVIVRVARGDVVRAWVADATGPLGHPPACLVLVHVVQGELLCLYFLVVGR